MSAISEYLTSILNSVYGEQVRSAIVNAITQCYDDVTNPNLNTEAFSTAIEAAYADGFLDIQEKSTIAGMTNEKIIYRYTGSEAGYITGALYFYNGTEWSPIGSALQTINNSSLMTNPNVIYLYNGKLYYHNGTSFVLVDTPIETDVTLTEKNVPADAKVVGLALDDLKPDDQLIYSNRPADARATGEAIKAVLGKFDEIEPYIDRIKEMIVAEDIDFDVSSLPDYWEDAVRDALVYTTALGDDYVHHLVTADNHYNANNMKSAGIQQLMWATGLYSKVICLGDITDGKERQEEVANVLTDYSVFGDDFLLAIGNHDRYLPEEPSYLLPLVEDNENLQGDVEHWNYYLDDDDNKIRYIIHNGPASANFQSQIPLITNAPSGYHSMFLCHYPVYDYPSAYYDPPIGAYHAMKDQNLFASVLMNDANFIGVFCGHEHIDYHLDYLSAGLVHQNALNCDANSTKDGVNYKRTDGTATEQAITIVSVNTKIKKVKLYRIGMPTTMGKRWEYSYKKDETPKIAKNIYLGSGAISTVSSDKMFTAFPALDNNKDYFLINNSNATLYYAYRHDYLSGTYVDRFTSVFPQYHFTKAKVRKIPRPSVESSDKFLFGFEMNETTANADDFEIVTHIEERAFGYSLEDVPWNLNKYPKGINYQLDTEEGSATSDLINVREGESYQFSVDDANWSAQYISVYAFSDDATITRIEYKNSGSNTSLSFTVPSNCKYVFLYASNLVGYTDKVQLVQTS